jgi:hypothetical protein
MALDVAAVNDLFDRLISINMALGDFEIVNGHEPKSKPGNGLSAALWVQDMKPLRSSGLASTTGLLTINERIYTSFLADPPDAIDPHVVAAAADVIAALSADFMLGDTIRNIDLLGAYSNGLNAQAGYLTQDGTVFRIVTLEIPCVIDDMFAQKVST